MLAPTLFSMLFSAMLTDAFVVAKSDLTLDRFNQRRLQAKAKVPQDTIRDFLFADDCALNAGTRPEMQESMNLFSTPCNDFGLTISTKTTEMMHQPAPAVPCTEPNVTVGTNRS